MNTNNNKAIRQKINELIEQIPSDSPLLSWLLVELELLHSLHAKNNKDSTASQQEAHKDPSSALEGYPTVLQACHIKEILGISQGKAYEVLNSSKCPTMRMGKRMVVLRDAFMTYLLSNQGKGHDLIE